MDCIARTITCSWSFGTGLMPHRPVLTSHAHSGEVVHPSQGCCPPRVAIG
jgi:hypothetical protein